MNKIPEYFTDATGTRHHLIACQIEYEGLKVQCADFRTRQENLCGAWAGLKRELRIRRWAIPRNKLGFIGGGGKVSYYTSC